MWGNFHNTGFGNFFQDKTPKAQKINWTLSKLKLYLSKDTIKRVKRQFCGFTEWGEIFANHISNKG